MLDYVKKLCPSLYEQIKGSNIELQLYKIRSGYYTLTLHCENLPKVDKDAFPETVEIQTIAENEITVSLKRNVKAWERLAAKMFHGVKLRNFTQLDILKSIILSDTNIDKDLVIPMLVWKNDKFYVTLAIQGYLTEKQMNGIKDKHSNVSFDVRKDAAFSTVLTLIHLSNLEVINV